MEFNKEQLNSIFPFHVLANSSLQIIDAGNGLKKIFPDLSKNQALRHFLELQAPVLDWSYEEIRQKEDKLFIFSIKDKSLQLKGQLINLQDQLLFILTPVVTDSSALKEFGITLKDFAKYDNIIDTLFLLNAQKMGLNESRQFYLRLLESNQKLEKANREIVEINENLEQKVIERTREIEQTLTELKATQAQLIQSEKMASLGELTAGIAHEIQNPLNFVNNFTEVSGELINEMESELKTGNQEQATVIANEIKLNLSKILLHGQRADAIVKSMLDHSHPGKGRKEPTDINALADEFLALAYHGYKVKESTFHCIIKKDFDPGVGKIEIVPQDISRVLLNLFNNAFYAVWEKQKAGEKGYEPHVSVATRNSGPFVEIKVEDNGNGIPAAIKDKVFQPFFTTKPAGQGTGLGLSISYDILKAAGGKLTLESTPGKETIFSVFIPAT